VRWFKLKVLGRPDADLDRLGRLADEQCADPDDFEAFWSEMRQRRGLAQTDACNRFCLTADSACTVFPGTRSPRLDCPIIIDGSDDGLDSLARALAAGYSGISSKNCKGFYKSILNAARIAQLASSGFPPPILSSEDLTTLAGVSVQQDLALVGLLGVSHVERNGRHFVDGMSFAPQSEQSAFLTAHLDLYHRETRPNGMHVVRLGIEPGELSLASLCCSGFAVAAEPSWDSMNALEIGA
jgi:hypothetical protein